jgi:hypothetical protein
MSCMSLWGDILEFGGITLIQLNWQVVEVFSKCGLIKEVKAYAHPLGLSRVAVCWPKASLVHVSAFLIRIVITSELWVYS